MFKTDKSRRLFFIIGMIALMTISAIFFTYRLSNKIGTEDITKLIVLGLLSQVPTVFVLFWGIFKLREKFK